MSYSTRAEVRDMVKDDALNAIIGDTFIEDPAEREELVSPIIDAAIADADAEIDGYLAKRYAVPLAPAPRVINKFSKDIAVYNLFSRIGIDEGTDQKTYLNRYNAAIKFLTLVAEGTVSIGTETEDPASAAAGGFKVKSDASGFAVGTNVKYAATHQFGEPGRTIRARKKKALRFQVGGKWVTKKQVRITIPARPFLGLSEDDMQEMKATVEEFIQKED